MMGSWTIADMKRLIRESAEEWPKMGKITDTHELNELHFNSNTDDGSDNGISSREYEESISATTDPTEDELQFNVQMTRWTLADMKGLIIEAAAQQLVGKFSDNQLSKLIEERAIELITEKADRVLEGVTDQIIDQPMTQSRHGQDPITMRELIGLYPRDYLSQLVDINGKPTSDKYYGSPRIERIVRSYVDTKFKKSLEDASNVFLREIQAAYKAKHEEIVEEAKDALFSSLASTFRPHTKKLD